MFENANFYPTPKPLIQKMFDKIDNPKRMRNILEPSSGKGDLIEGYKECWVSKNKRYMGYDEKVDKYIKFDAIEIDNNLSSILKGNGYNVVWDDFLTFEPQRFYDLILANFPFSNGCDHLLKAIRIQERVGGEIVCLLNAETLKNTYSNNRKYLTELLSNYNADIEYIENAFVESERSTTVEVALIHVAIPMADTITMFEKEFKKDNPDIEFEEFQAITTRKSKIEQLVIECEIIKKSVIELFKEKMRVDNLLSGMGLSSKILLCNDYYKREQLTINEFVENTDLEYWNKFINETDFLNRLPSKLRNTFRCNMEKQRNIPFTTENAYYFYEELMMAIPQSYEETCATVFDDITRKYSYTDSVWNKNIHLYDGWKTNNCMKIGDKCIIPCYFSYGLYSLPDTLLDLNIIFNNITGTRDDIINNYDSGVRKAIEHYEKNIETKHFILDSYKKGTIHIKFKDKEAVKKFNLMVAKGKMWLPPSFGKKNWTDMDEEEKQAIINFGIEPKEYTLYTGKVDYLRLMEG